MLFKSKCPFCGTCGKIWNKRSKIFICPHCSSIFSDFGVILQSEREEEKEIPFYSWM